MKKAPITPLQRVMAAITVCSTAAYAGVLAPDLVEEMRGAAPDDVITSVVMLPNQIDRDAFLAEMRATGASLHERHVAAVTRMRKMAQTDQAALRHELERGLESGGVVDFQPFWITNGIALTATRSVIEEVADREDVRTVFPAYPISLIDPVRAVVGDEGAVVGSGIEGGVTDIRAPELWNMGIRGQGAIVANMDTGVDGDHPALGSRYLGHRKPAAQCWFDPVTHTNFPQEFSGSSHGTHTMGTITGEDLAGSNQIGVAPDAEWISAGVIDRVSIDQTILDAIAAFQWFADPDGNPQTSDDVPCVVSNSWGISPLYHGVPHCDDTFWNVIDNCELAGAAVVYAAGNEGGGSKTLRTPADRITTSVNVFSVGALQAGSESITSWSSRGPSGCDNVTIKPEVTARGDNVRSSVNGGGYGQLSGTSMACPHVAGAIGLLKSAFPEATPEQLKQSLYQSAVDLGSFGEDNTYGRGRIDLVEALAWLEENLGGSVEVTLDPENPPVVVPGEGGDITFTWGVNNPTGWEKTFQGWLDVEYLDRLVTRTVRGPYTFTLNPGQTRGGTVTIYMNGSYPDGDYEMTAKAGTHPNDVDASDSFMFQKGN